MEIEKKLKAARLNAGMTQEQVAEKIMVSRQTVSNWETGKSLPDIISIINMSDLYQISLDELLKGDRKMKEKLKKDIENANDNKRLILTTALMVLFVVVVYLLSIFIGGVFYDFCKNAIIWILMGLGVAFSSVYLKQKE